MFNLSFMTRNAVSFYGFQIAIQTFIRASERHRTGYHRANKRNQARHFFLDLLCSVESQKILYSFSGGYMRTCLTDALLDGGPQH